MDTAYLNSLVGDFLSTVDKKFAEKFKKETKACPLPPGPNLAEMVNHFNKRKLNKDKRKLNMSKAPTPAKKARKVRIS